MMMNTTELYGTWKSEGTLNKDGERTGKLPFSFIFKEGGNATMKFLFFPFKCTWEFSGNKVIVHGNKNFNLELNEDGMLVLYGENNTQAFFHKVK